VTLPSRQKSRCAGREPEKIEKLIFFGEDTARDGEDMEVETPRPDLQKERVEEEDEKFVLEVEM
jgi:hypothetical protein